METVWQDLVALGIVALAAGYIAYCGWRLLLRNRRSACGGCHGCSPGDAQTSAPQQLVSLEPQLRHFSGRL